MNTDNDSLPGAQFTAGRTVAIADTLSTVIDERAAQVPTDDHDRSRRAWLRLLDNLVRRILLYLLPVVLMLALGGWVTRDTVDQYASFTTLDASSNPLLDDLEVRGGGDLDRFTAALATANFLEERLRTDEFAATVAEAVELGSAIDAGLLEPDDVADSVTAYTEGDSVLVVEATWDDPITAQRLTQATVDSFRDYIVEVVASDGSAAIDFFAEREAQAAREVDTAVQALDDYARSLPVVADSSSLSVEQQLTIDRLTSALERAESNADDVQSEIEAAELQVAQSRSEAGLSVRVIDPPSRPTTPEPRGTLIAGVVLAFGALGLLISISALVLTTLLDRSVRFAGDVAAATGTPAVVTIRDLKRLRRTSRTKGRLPNDRLGTEGISARPTKPRARADAMADGPTADERRDATADGPAPDARQAGAKR